MQQELRHFVHLQHQLIGAFESRFEQASWHTIPRTGELEADGAMWAFVRHGGGVRFRRANNTVVDMHDELEAPDLFDACRLRTYFGSLRTAGVRMVARVAMTDQGNLGTLLGRALSILEATGQVEREGWHYRLLDAPDPDPTER